MARQTPYVSDAIDEFLALKAPKAKKTLAAHFALLRGTPRGTKKALGPPFEGVFLGRRCSSIKPVEVSHWYAARCEGAAQSTKHRFSKNAREFLRFLARRGYTAEDLESAIERQSDGSGRVVWLDWDEIHRFLAGIESFRVRFAIAWIFYTGCRISEAIRADHMDVYKDAERGMYVWNCAEGKTHHPRIVWLPDTLGEMVEKARRLNSPKATDPLLWGCAGRGKHDLEDSKRRIAMSTIRLELENAEARAGLMKHVIPHVARHSYCTLWIQAQGDGERSLTKLSNQTGVSVTQLRKTYLHLNLKAEEFDAIRSFGAGCAPMCA